MRSILLHFASLLVGLGLAVSANADDHGSNKEPLKKLTDKVYQYSEGGYVSLVAVTKKGVLITDPANAGRAANLKKAIKGISEKPVTHIVLSHEHYDHVGGTEVFEKAKVYCHANCQEIFDLDVMNMTPNKVDVSYEGLKKLKVGGLKVELHGFGVADGNGYTALYLPDEKVAFMADLYMPKAFNHASFMDDVNLLGVQKVLNAMSEWDLDYVVNSHHDDPSAEALHENARFLNEFVEKGQALLVKTLQEQGMQGLFGLTTNPPELDLSPEYKKWEGYEHLPRHFVRLVGALVHGG